MKFFRWVKDNALAVVSVFGAIAAAFAFYQFQSKQLGSLKDAVTVEKARTKIAKARAEKEMHKAAAEDTRVQEIVLDEQIAQTKREVVAIKKEVEGLSDDEVAAEFESLF